MLEERTYIAATISASKSSEFTIDWVDCDGIDTLMVRFEVVGNGLLRATKEYSLICIPETNEWFGDVIAYGQRWDLESEEMDQLREEYGLDAVMKHASKGLPLY